MTAVQSTAPATTPAPLRAEPEIGQVSLLRLVRVELRKLADTRAGMWLLIVIGLASVATDAILLGFGADAEQTFREFFAFGMLPAGVLLPVLGILSMTGEWSQRTALTTFALVPARGRVITAKLLAAMAIAVLATAAAGLTAAAGNLIGIGLGGDGSWSIPLQVVAQCVLLQVILVLMGSAFGALLMNSPVAIVLYFALPMVWTILGEMIRGLRRAGEWLDINLTTAPMVETALSDGQWARLGVSVAVWVALPLVAGTIRVLRREVS